MTVGPYPTRYVQLSDAEREARTNAFRAKNPGAWSFATLDAFGFVGSLMTKSGPLIDDCGQADL